MTISPKSDFWSSDEDFALFLDDLITLLNKYHYNISDFNVSRIKDPELMCVAFQAVDGGSKVSARFLNAKDIRYKDEK